MIRNLRSLKPTVSAIPVQSKGNRCPRKMHFLITKHGLGPKHLLNLTTPHRDLEIPITLSVFLNWGIATFGARQIFGCRTVPCKGYSPKYYSSLWHQQNAWTLLLIENNLWYFGWRLNWHAVGLIYPASMFWLVYLVLNKITTITNE